MARLEDLPIELLTFIMCDCDSIKSVLRLSSTCKTFQQVWHGNALSIAHALFPFTKSQLLDFVKLSKIEASPPGKQTPQESPQESADLNGDVRQYLRYIESSAFAVQIICMDYVREAINETVRHERELNLQLPPTRSSVPLFGDPTLFDAWPSIVQAWLLLRRLAVGYDHPRALADVYATWHRLRKKRNYEAWDFTRLVNNHFDETFSTYATEYLGVAFFGGEFFASVSQNMDFAIRSVHDDGYIHCDLDKPGQDDLAVGLYHGAVARFGEERLRAMYGEATHRAYMQHNV
jgi:hypothetical protein